MTTYEEFLNAKAKAHVPKGVIADSLHASLFPFQAHCTKWALETGRACLFAGTGLGKTIMQCEWARNISSGKRLIVAPLGVAMQTTVEARRHLGMRIVPIQTTLSGDIPIGTYIVNYDGLHHAWDVEWDAVVLDESSILKSHDGATRKKIQDRFEMTPYKLACTATPAPNDYMELGTHAEFVGAMSRAEMLATYFTHDGGDTSKWRLKRHAVSDFWRWVSTWAMVLSHPSDIGYDDDGYELPDLIFIDHVIDVEPTIGQGLFGDSKVSATGLFKTMRDSAYERCAKTAEIVNADQHRQWLVWCHTDAEQKLLSQMIPRAFSVSGADIPSKKEHGLMGFAEGIHPVLITKPKIGGFGMNWQRCSRMVFCGVTYSFEQVYQCIRRCWRFGQDQDVIVHMVTDNATDSVKSALTAKERAFSSMSEEMRKYAKNRHEVSR